MMKKILCLVLFFMVFPFAHVVAQAGQSPEDTTVELINPIGGTETDPKGVVDQSVIFGKAIRVTLGFLGTFTLLVFFYGGFLWLTSAGSSDKVQKGTQTMLYAVVGLFIIFGAYAILNTVIKGIRGEATGGTPSGQIDGGGPVGDPKTAECDTLDKATCSAQSDRCTFFTFQIPNGDFSEGCIPKQALGGYCDSNKDACYEKLGDDDPLCDAERDRCYAQ